MKNNLTIESDQVLRKFGDKVRIFRKLRGMSQLDLATEIEIDARHIQRIEKGKINTSILIAFSIANALSVTMNDLFDLEQE